MTTDLPTPYLLMKRGTASKLGQRAKSGIAYYLLADGERRQPFLTIVANDGGSYFSREIVPFEKIEAYLTDQGAEQVFRSRIFRSALVGKSTNNAGFLAAILQAEDLLEPAPDAPHHYVRLGD